MTIKECIDIVDNAKPNQYGIKEKVMWLSFVDETIINDVLKTHEGYDGRYDNFEGYTEDKLSVPLIVPSPYDRLYPQYIKMMIDSENGETARYNNSAALYNTYLNEYKKYYNKTHMPLNATQKIPSPVSININSHLSDAQIEYIKRQLYYMLSQDVGEVISHDKLYDIVTSFVSNNLEMLKTKLAMSYKGETSVLPDNAKTGDVCRVTKTLYEKDAYYVPIKWGDVQKVGSNYRYYFTANGYEGVITKMIPNVIGNFAVGDGNTRISLPVVSAGESDGYYIEASKFVDITNTCYIYVPSDIGDSHLGVGRAAIRFLKGEYASYTANGWKPMRADGFENIMYMFADLKTYVDNGFLNCGGDDAELLGDAPMVFKGVVSELPETANEGEVYVHSSTESGFEKETEFTTSVMLHLNVNDIRCEDSAEATLLYNTVQSGSFITMKLVIGGSEYIYRECSIYEYGPYGVTIDSKSSEGIDGYTPIDSGTKVEVYKETEVAVKKTYVYYCGEWVEL